MWPGGPVPQVSGDAGRVPLTPFPWEVWRQYRRIVDEDTRMVQETMIHLEWVNAVVGHEAS